ncbi:MAG TPA: hypothetical protein VM662_06370 [Sphingomonas sp.]|nr:hypothetical protein [Sphingomonas sp.]
MVREMVVAALCAALVPLSAGAQDAADPGASAPQAPEKKICRRQVATGSVMARITCRTKAEWDALTARGQNDIERQAAQERARANLQNSR